VASPSLRGEDSPLPKGTQLQLPGARGATRREKKGKYARQGDQYLEKEKRASLSPSWGFPASKKQS